ncbi:MAG: hypothetical protein KJP07_07175 [Desulfatitalea sp.]|nr:hypothetical protein [Desulfatitalea sp.]
MEKIAIIGMGCLFPGSKTPSAYYQSLLNNESFLKDDYDFQIEHSNFDIPVDIHELNKLDEIFTHTLYVAHEAMKDSGYLKNPAVLDRTGIILGNRETVNEKIFDLFSPTYFNELEKHFTTLLNSPNFCLNNISNSNGVSPLNIFHFSYPTIYTAETLNMKGPAFAIEAACSSSLYAIRLASYYLLSHATDLMIAGGVFVGKRNKAFPTLIDKLGVTPKGTNSRPLDKNSEGLIANEGAGAVAIKRLSDAVRDKDQIYAVIENIGWSNDGSGKFFLAPSVKGQINAFTDAYSRTDTKEIDYIECHATGTQVGDTIELNSMERFFNENKRAPLYGSVKGNIGHLFAAAGIASLIKVIYSMKEGVIPATFDISTPSASKNGAFSKNNLVGNNTPWPNSGMEKRAGISAFGFGGINAHMVIKEYDYRNEALYTETNNIGKNEVISITGVGAHIGDIIQKDNVQDALFYGRTPSLQNNAKRFRGFNEIKESEIDAISRKAFSGGHYFSAFDFDFMKNKIHSKDEGEALTKELLMLNVANEALEDAGFVKGAAQNVAVIICARQNLFQLHFYLDAYLNEFIVQALRKANISYNDEELEKLVEISKSCFLKSDAGIDLIATGIGPIVATRISSVWNFTGPSFKMCCLENSFIQALELAQSLLGEKSVDAVLVGAVDGDPLLESAIWNDSHAEAYGLSPQSMVYGEGAAAFVLKRKSDAVASGESIYANIESINISNSGCSKDLGFAPDTFVDVLKTGLESANISADQIGYLEFFGSALYNKQETLLRELDKYLSDVKTGKVNAGSAGFNFGYSMTTSSAFSVLKSALMMKNWFLSKLPKKIISKLETQDLKRIDMHYDDSFWYDEAGCTYSSILGGSFTGTASHLLLSGNDTSLGSESASSIEHGKSADAFRKNSSIFIIDGIDRNELTQNLHAFKKKLEKNPNLRKLSKDCLFNCMNSENAQYKMVFVGDSISSLLSDSTSAINEINATFSNKSEWSRPSGSYFTAAPLGKVGKIAVCYPPSGLNTPKALYEYIAAFPEAAAFIKDIVAPVNVEMTEILSEFNNLSQNKNKFPLFTDWILGNLATHLILNDISIRPDHFIGMSFGEFVLFTSTEIVSDEGDTDLLTQLIVPTLNLMSDESYLRSYYQDDTLKWANYLCKGNETSIKSLTGLISKEECVFVAINASPKNIFISGRQADCERLIKKTNCLGFPINRGMFAHTPPAMDFYDRIVQENLNHPLKINKIINRSYYKTYARSTFDFTRNDLAKWVADCICRPMDFVSIVEKSYDDGARIFIGMDTTNTCSSWLNDILDEKEVLILPIMQSGMNLKTSVRSLIAKLISHGVNLELEKFIDTREERRARPSLVKTILNDPPTISEVILTEENVKMFSPYEKSIPFSIQKENESPKVETIKPEINVEAHILPVQPSYSEADEKHLSPMQTFQDIEKQTDKTITYDSFLQKIFDRNLKIQDSYLQVQGRHLELLSDEFYGETQPEQVKDIKTTPFKVISRIDADKRIIWDQNEIYEMARNKLSTILGPKYAEVDNYPIRARLPLPPFMFVSRVTDIQGEFCKLEPAMIEIEYDIPDDAWYCAHDQAAFTVVNESSHCGILLLSYIGVDILFKGKRHFRALDSSIQIYSERLFHAGETFRGVFKITSFIENKDTLLVLSTYDVYDADNTHIFKIKAIGGLFTKDQLLSAKNYPIPKNDIKRINPGNRRFKPILKCGKTSFSESDIENMQIGREDLCFGKGYSPTYNTELIYPKNFKVLDRVTRIDINSGSYGLGFIVGETDINPDLWIFDAHFHNDPVLPAIYSVEGGIQLLKFYAYYIGLNMLVGSDIYPSPISDSYASSKFRGEVKRKQTTLRYECHIKKITTDPNVSLVADIYVIDGKRLVTITEGMGMRLNKRESADERLVAKTNFG